MVAQRITDDLVGRIAVMLDLGLGYLSLERSTPTLSPGELQRLRLPTQVRSNLFGVVYVLDEPSAGLHPVDTEALLRALQRLKASGNSLFIVEHDLEVVRAADWIVDVGPAAGEQGGQVLYSGRLAGLGEVRESQTRRYLFADAPGPGRKTDRSAYRVADSRMTRFTSAALSVGKYDISIAATPATTGLAMLVPLSFANFPFGVVE